MEQGPYIKIKCIDPIMPSDIILHYAFTASHMSPVDQPTVVCDSLLDFFKDAYSNRHVLHDGYIF